MNARLEQAIRIGISSLVGALLAYSILKIGDTVIPLISPSLLFTGGAYVWVFGMIWWMSAGLGLGICAALGMIRSELVNTFPLNALSALLSIIAVVAFSSYQRFAVTAMPITGVSYILTFATNLVFFLLMASLPALLGILIGRWITALFAKKHSAYAIMPDELRQQLQQQQASHK